MQMSSMILLRVTAVSRHTQFRWAHWHTTHIRHLLDRVDMVERCVSAISNVAETSICSLEVARWLQAQHCRSQQAVTVALEWRNLTYTVPVGKGKKKRTKKILDRLTGVAPPGHLLAIMGPTGAPSNRTWDN